MPIEENGIIDEKGADYTIFKDKNGNRYVSSLKSGNVPKNFFPKTKEKFDFTKPHDVDIRDIDERYWMQTYEDVEWYKKPTQFKHFKARIDLLDSDDMEFYSNLKYKILNLIPTINKELESQIYQYLNERFGKKKLKRIIQKCARYRLRQEGRMV